MCLLGFCLAFANNIFKYFITIDYVHDNNDTKILYLYFVYYIFYSIAYDMIYISTLAFNYRMCDESLAAIYLTTLTAV